MSLEREPVASDGPLLARIADADEAALGELYDRHAGAVHGLLVQMLGRTGEAEEVLQEAFLQAWRQAARFDVERASARGWLLMIARSRALDRLRSTASSSRREREVAQGELVTPSAAPSPASGVEERERREGVRSALGQLPVEQRHCLVLAFFGGLTHSQIAERLDVPLGTVKSRILLGMGKLRGLLAPYRT